MNCCRYTVPAALIAVFVVSVRAEAPTADSGPPMKEALQCFRALDGRPELAPLAGKVTVTGEARDTLEMQAIDTRPNPIERVAISKWVTARQPCFDLGIEWMDQAKVPNWFRAAMLESKDSADALASALYRGELTFGQFNVKHMALTAELRKRLNDGVESHRADATVPQPATSPGPAQETPRPSLEVARYQCETDATRTYPVLPVQRMTDPGFQAPNQQRTQQTTCSGFGAQMVCRTAPTGVDTSIYNRPPTYVTEDANLRNRQSAFASCMEANGFHRR
jgi:hypothetical protein